MITKDKYFSKKVKVLLFEAYRRNELFAKHDSWENSKPLEKRWLGLGTEAAYKPGLKAGLFVFFDGETPPIRCQGWLCLTESGIKEMRKHESEFKETLESALKDGYGKTIHANYQLAGGLTRT